MIPSTVKRSKAPITEQLATSKHLFGNGSGEPSWRRQSADRVSTQSRKVASSRETASTGARGQRILEQDSSKKTVTDNPIEINVEATAADKTGKTHRAHVALQYGVRPPHVTSINPSITPTNALKTATRSPPVITHKQRRPPREPRMHIGRAATLC